MRGAVWPAAQVLANAVVAPPSHPNSCLSASRPPPSACALQEVADGWGGYSDLQQQDLFGALQLPVAAGDWEQLEGRLQVALDLASLF